MSEFEAAHLDKLLDECEWLSGAAEQLQSPDDLATLSPGTATKPKWALASFYDVHLWSINQIFDWWLLLVGGRAGK